MRPFLTLFCCLVATFQGVFAANPSMTYDSSTRNISPTDGKLTAAQVNLGAAGVRLTGDGDGAITLLGLGNGSDEDLTLNLDDVANTITWSSSTGVNLFIFSSIDVQVPTEVYDATGWNGDNTVPTKDAVRDKIESLGAGAGDVTAASSFGTDNRLIRSDGTGKGVQGSGITINDSDNMIVPGGIDPYVSDPFSPAVGQGAGASAGAGNTFSVFFGYGAGQYATASQTSVFVGSEAGRYAAASPAATLVGYHAGGLDPGASVVGIGYGALGIATNSALTIAVGTHAGEIAHNSDSSVFLGYYSGYLAENSEESVLIGGWAGKNSPGVVGSIFMGFEAGQYATNSDHSIFIGYNSGKNETGGIDKSIFLGDFAGTNRDNTLWIDTQATTQDGSYLPLIYGEFDNRVLKVNGLLYSTTFRLPTGNDPDTTSEGQISYDANGDVLRAYDGAQQVAIGRKIEAIHVTVISPNDLADAQRDAFLFWSNESGMSFIVTGWKGWSGTDDTTLNIEEVDADGVGNNATVDAVELATGSGPYTGSDTTISGATIENGHMLVLDFDDTDTPTYVKITITGYYNADVN